MLLNVFAKSKSKINLIIDITVISLFALNFFSVPIFSFNEKMFYITWILTILLIGLVVLDLILFYTIQFDFLFLSLIIFAFSSLLSSALNLFSGFRLTPILLSVLISFVYLFCKNTKLEKELMLSAFLGNVAFLLFFVVYYRSSFLSLKLSRLGEAFGDVNDVSLFMAFGFLFSFYILFFKKNIIFKVFSFLLLILFGICGLSTGSKIFIVILAVCIPVLIFLFFGKKKWYLSIIFVTSLFASMFLILQIPAFNSIKTRFYDMISTFFGKSIDNSRIDETSTIERVEFFLAGIELFFKKPLFGWGIWGFATHAKINYGWSHNNISESLCNFGLVGSFFFHYCFVGSLKCFFTSKEKKKSALYFVVVLFFVVSMISVALNSEKIYALLAPIAFSKLSQEEPLTSLSVRDKINIKMCRGTYENC